VLRAAGGKPVEAVFAVELSCPVACRRLRCGAPVWKTLSRRFFPGAQLGGAATEEEEAVRRRTAGPRPGTYSAVPRKAGGTMVMEARIAEGWYSIDGKV